MRKLDADQRPNSCRKLSKPALRGAAAGGRGFTLVELMVALLLAAIISLCISKVSSDAQRSFKSTVTKVELYQKFRYALADVKCTLANWEVTSDLEFFIDNQSKPNGHWDDGEEIKQADNLSGGLPGYDEAAILLESKYTHQPQFGNPEEHDNFLIYFRAPTIVNGSLRVTNVEYFIADPSAGEGVRATGEIGDAGFKNLALVKVVRWVDTSKQDFFKVERTVSKKVVELCQNVTDFKIEYFYDNEHDSRPGAFLVPSDELSSEKVKSEVLPKLLGDGSVLKRFMYGGFRQEYYIRGSAAKGDRDVQKSIYEPVEFSVGGAESGVNFSELGLGDKVFLFKDSSSAGSSMRVSDYQIAQKFSGKLRFHEAVDFSSWDGPQNGVLVKAGFMPSSLRVTLTVLNDEGKKPRILQAIIHPFRKRT